MFVLVVILDYIVDNIFIGCIINNDYIFLWFIFKYSRVYACSVSYVDFLRAERCCLYHHGTDNCHFETTFTWLYTKPAISLIWNVFLYLLQLYYSSCDKF